MNGAGVLADLRGAANVERDWGDRALASKIDAAADAVAELIEAAQEVIDGTVNATTYPDGPCIERSDRERLTTAIARVQGEAA